MADGQGATVTAPCRRTDGQLIGSDKKACVECWGCVRYCPAKAIRVVDRHSEVIAEKCVACGLCVSGVRPFGTLRA